MEEKFVQIGNNKVRLSDFLDKVSSGWEDYLGKSGISEKQKEFARLAYTAITNAINNGNISERNNLHLWVDKSGVLTNNWIDKHGNKSDKKWMDPNGFAANYLNTIADAMPAYQEPAKTAYSNDDYNTFWKNTAFNGNDPSSVGWSYKKLGTVKGKFNPIYSLKYFADMSNKYADYLGLNRDKYSNYSFENNLNLDNIISKYRVAANLASKGVLNLNLYDAIRAVGQDPYSIISPKDEVNPVVDSANPNVAKTPDVTPDVTPEVTSKPTTQVYDLSVYNYLLLHRGLADADKYKMALEIKAKNNENAKSDNLMKTVNLVLASDSYRKNLGISTSFNANARPVGYNLNVTDFVNRNNLNKALSDFLKNVIGNLNNNTYNLETLNALHNLVTYGVGGKDAQHSVANVLLEKLGPSSNYYIKGTYNKPDNSAVVYNGLNNSFQRISLASNLGTYIRGEFNKYGVFKNGGIVKALSGLLLILLKQLQLLADLDKNNYDTTNLNSDISYEDASKMAKYKKDYLDKNFDLSNPYAYRHFADLLYALSTVLSGALMFPKLDKLPIIKKLNPVPRIAFLLGEGFDTVGDILDPTLKSPDFTKNLGTRAVLGGMQFVPFNKLRNKLAAGALSLTGLGIVGHDINKDPKGYINSVKNVVTFLPSALDITNVGNSLLAVAAPATMISRNMVSYRNPKNFAVTAEGDMVPLSKNNMRWKGFTHNNSDYVIQNKINNSNVPTIKYTDINGNTKIGELKPDEILNAIANPNEYFPEFSEFKGTPVVNDGKFKRILNVLASMKGELTIKNRDMSWTGSRFNKLKTNIYQSTKIPERGTQYTLEREETPVVRTNSRISFGTDGKVYSFKPTMDSSPIKLDVLDNLVRVLNDDGKTFSKVYKVDTPERPLHSESNELSLTSNNTNIKPSDKGASAALYTYLIKHNKFNDMSFIDKNNRQVISINGKSLSIVDGNNINIISENSKGKIIFKTPTKMDDAAKEEYDKIFKNTESLTAVLLPPTNNLNTESLTAVLLPPTNN